MHDTFWVGKLEYLPSLYECLLRINMRTTNSGFYKPEAINIKGMNGYFLINQDGSIFWESRVLKLDENKFLIEHLTNEGCRVFENEYRALID